jgi:acetoin utilization protein AcuB
LPTLLSHFASSLSVQEPGAIIVLEMSVNDFVLSEIARIVESNDTKILSLFIHSEKDTMQMQVHLKLNKKDVSALIQTFVRFNYTIMAYFDANDDIDDLRKRYDALMKYLNP